MVSSDSNSNEFIILWSVARQGGRRRTNFDSSDGEIFQCDVKINPLLTETLKCVQSLVSLSENVRIVKFNLASDE